MGGRPSRVCFRPQHVPFIFGIAAILALTGTAYAAAEIRIVPTTLYFGAAGPSSAAPAASERPEEVSEGLPAPGIRPKALEALREKAREKSGVRVLVRLETAFTPEGRLGTAQAVGQRQAIRQAQDAALSQLAGTGARVYARFQRIPFLALELDAATLDLIASLPGVVGIEEDVIHKPLLASSTAVVGAGTAWASGLTGAGQTIAILDSGVDKAHPFFSSGGQNKVVSEACYSSTVPSSSSTSLCPGGAQEATGSGSGVNCSLSASSGCGHGTHVAGIAAGNAGTGPNFGVARDADVISIRSSRSSTGTPSGPGPATSSRAWSGSTRFRTSARSPPST